MMDDDKRFGPSPMAPGAEAPANQDSEVPAPEAPDAGAPASAEPVVPPAGPAPAADSTAVMKFKACRWRCDPEDGEFCTHRDVLPYAGKEGFSADSWCPECAFYKLRRTPKKRERVDYTY